MARTSYPIAHTFSQNMRGGEYKRLRERVAFRTTLSLIPVFRRNSDNDIFVSSISSEDSTANICTVSLAFGLVDISTNHF
jgi:hypothetical protein